MYLVINLLWRWRQYIPLNCYQSPTRIYSIKTYNITIRNIEVFLATLATVWLGWKRILLQDLGLPLTVRSRMQLNLVVHNTRLNPRVEMFSNHTLPIFWLDWVSCRGLLLHLLYCALGRIFTSSHLFRLLSCSRILLCWNQSFVTKRINQIKII
jgi:hypothetical protein